MSRRTKSTKEEKKQARHAKKEARKQDNREDFERVIIACEGTVTEKNYFQSIFNELIKTKKIAKTSLVIAKHNHTDPEGVLNDLLQELERDSDFEHQWIVIDRDEMRPNGGGHTLTNFNNAIQQAAAKNIHVAYSNPSFELWYLLHFEYRNTLIDRDDVIKELNEYIDYGKNSTSVYEDVLSNQNTAIENAKRLENHFTTGGRILQPATDNPSSTVYRLVEVLNSLSPNSQTSA